MDGCRVNGRLENNSPNGWTDQLENNSPNRLTGGESNGGLKNNLPNEWTDGELNGRLEKDSPDQWTEAELNGRLKNNSSNRWICRESNGGLKDKIFHFSSLKRAKHKIRRSLILSWHEDSISKSHRDTAFRFPL